MSRRRSARRALRPLRKLSAARVADVVDLKANLSLVPEEPAPTVNPDDTGETRRRRHRAAYAFYITTGVVVTAIILGVYVFPTQTWLRQRRATAEINHKIDVIDQTNAALAAEVKRLDTDSEIQRVAREKFGLVMPGEQAFAVLPASAPPFPDSWPYNLVKGFFFSK